MELRKLLKERKSFGEMLWGPGYEAFELLDNSMSEDTPRGLFKADILKCKKIECLNKIDDLKAFKDKLVVVTSTEAMVGRISLQDGDTIVLSRYNPAFKDITVDLTKVETLYLVESFQRQMGRKAEARRAQTPKI